MAIFNEWINGFKKETEKILENNRRQHFLDILISNKHRIMNLSVYELKDILDHFNITLTVEELLNLLSRKK